MAAPPCFLQILPIETDATDGDIVTFQVKVSSDPSDPTVVSWWRCGESLRPMPGHLEMIEHEDGWHELILSNITEEDEGEYECRAENHRGHNSCFGSLYYYQEGGGTLTDVAMAGMTEEGDGRQSGLLILIDDGSHTEEESLSGHSDRKSMTVSEQMQGIIEDLTQSSQGEHTGSITLEKEDDNQFCSDIEDLCDDDLEANIIQNILGMKKQGSEETLIPEMPSPDLTGDVAYSEGASDPYAPTAPSEHHKWRSNPNDVSKEKRDKQEAKEKQTQGVWPSEPSGVTFYLPQDNTVTTSVELPYTRDSSSTTEEAPKGSWRCADTPFDVADITEETADVDSSSKDAGSLRQSPTDGSSKLPEESEGVVGPLAPDSRVASRIDTTSLTSVSQILGEAIHPEGCQLNKMSFTKSSFKASSYQYTDDGLMDTSTSVRTTSVTSRLSSTTFDQESVSVQQRSVRRELEDDSFTFSSKKTRLTSAYEADESSLSTSHRAVQDSFLTESIMEGRVSLYFYHLAH